MCNTKHTLSVFYSLTEILLKNKIKCTLFFANQHINGNVKITGNIIKFGGIYDE